MQEKEPLEKPSQTVNNELFSAFPQNIPQIFGASFSFYRAHAKALISISALSTLPLILTILFYKYFMDLSGKDLEAETRIYMILNAAFDLLREYFTDTVILLSFPIVFKEGFIDLKRLLSEYFSGYVLRVVVSSMLMILFLVFTGQFLYVLMLLFLFFPLFYVFQKDSPKFLQAIKDSTLVVVSNLFPILGAVLIINILTKLPEVIALTFSIQGEALDTILNSGDNEALVGFVVDNYLLNYDFIIANTLIKLIIQPLKSLFYCFLFFMLIKRMFSEQVLSFFEMNNPLKNDHGSES